MRDPRTTTLVWPEGSGWTRASSGTGSATGSPSGAGEGADNAGGAAALRTIGPDSPGTTVGRIDRDHRELRSVAATVRKNTFFEATGLPAPTRHPCVRTVRIRGMNTQDAGHCKAAVGALAAAEYTRAGDEYTRAGWRVLADPRPEVDTFEIGDHGWVGGGLSHLVVAAVCYRVAGHNARATRRAIAGVAEARELAAAADHPIQRACFLEFVGDFRAAGGLDGAAEAYDAAADAYRAAGDAIEDPRRWATTPLFEAAAAPLKQVARGPANGEIAVEWSDLHGSDPADPGAFLAARASYKRQRFRSLVERVADEGDLAAPRGTTEYDTDHHQCPVCGSTDVNWIESNVLCLRCSAPTAEQ